MPPEAAKSAPLTTEAAPAPVEAQAALVDMPAPKVVEAPPLEAPAPKPVQQSVKHVRVLNFQTPTFTPPTKQRLPTENMETYARRALKAKFELLRDALTEGLPKQSAPTDLCYFVVPEFFWNVNWDAANNEEDLRVFSETCVTEVKKHVRALIELFPQEQFGKLALLPGTAQVLVKLKLPSLPPAAFTEKVGDKNLTFVIPVERIYEALNYVLVIDNFSKTDANGIRPLRMWPKRHVSYIDFSTRPIATWWPSRSLYHMVHLGNLDILVSKISTTTAKSYAEGKTYDGFDNDPLGGVPFGIDVCLDYAMFYKDGAYARMSQIQDTNYIIDFLIACGMKIDVDQNYLPSVQYIVRNDGLFDAREPSGHCEILKLSAPADKDKLGKRARHERIDQTQVAQPRGSNSILFDSYFDVHPLWDYAPVTRPLDVLPSLIAP